MSRIFISYRRDDSIGHAGRLLDRLQGIFGQDAIFLDLATISPGEDYVATIESVMESYDVLLVLIGDRWLSAKDRGGRFRLRDTSDFVRREIEAALKLNILIIPVLLDGVEMVASEELPDSLKGLVRRQAIELRTGSFHQDVDQLAQVIRRDAPDYIDPESLNRILMRGVEQQWSRFGIEAGMLPIRLNAVHEDDGGALGRLIFTLRALGIATSSEFRAVLPEMNRVAKHVLSEFAKIMCEEPVTFVGIPADIMTIVLSLGAADRLPTEFHWGGTFDQDKEQILRKAMKEFRSKGFGASPYRLETVLGRRLAQ